MLTTGIRDKDFEKLGIEDTPEYSAGVVIDIENIDYVVELGHLENDEFYLFGSEVFMKSGESVMVEQQIDYIMDRMEEYVNHKNVFHGIGFS